jgi:Ni/Fe-hydrogenase subunit HybB-like protein
MKEMIEPKKKFPWGTLILSALAFLCAGVLVQRYVYGLGAMTNMSDGRGWGLWISFDLYCGVALAAGGFTLAAIVHVFNMEKYHPVVRPAILTAFLGYLLVVLALLVDLGEPWYIWRMIFNPNIHSPLYEVGWCVMLYTAVLALEMSPALFERLNWRIPLRIIGFIQIPLIIAGIVISTGHQNSLGSMLLIMTHSLDPLWYTPIIPALFFVSAVAVGPAMVIFEGTLSGAAFGHKISREVLTGLGRIVSGILVVYLIMRLADLAVAGQFDMLFNRYPQNIYWWVEILGGVVLPIILFNIPKVQQSNKGMFIAALLYIVLGLSFNRFIVTSIWLVIRPGYTYFPSWQEFAVSIGLVAWALLMFQIAVRLLPITKHPGEEEAKSEHGAPEATPAS